VETTAGEQPGGDLGVRDQPRLLVATPVVRSVIGQKLFEVVQQEQQILAV
jgi:hypothetical protein